MDRAAIDEAFPPYIDSVYVVYTGTFASADGKQQGLAGQVCSRIKEDDARGIADMLNEATEGVMYLKFVASNFFPKASGNRDELEQAANNDDVRAAWEKLIAPHRREVYRVAHLKIKNEDDIERFNDELAK